MRAHGPGPGIRDARSHGPSDGAFGSVRHAAHGYPYAWQRMGIYGIRGGRDRASVVGQGDSTDLPGTHTDTYPTPSFWSAPNPTPRPDSHTAPAALISHCSQAPALCHWPPSGHPPPCPTIARLACPPTVCWLVQARGFLRVWRNYPKRSLVPKKGHYFALMTVIFRRKSNPNIFKVKLPRICCGGRVALMPSWREFRYFIFRAWNVLKLA